MVQRADIDLSIPNDLGTFIEELDVAIAAVQSKMRVVKGNLGTVRAELYYSSLE